MIRQRASTIKRIKVKHEVRITTIKEGNEIFFFKLKNTPSQTRHEQNNIGNSKKRREQEPRRYKTTTTITTTKEHRKNTEREDGGMWNPRLSTSQEYRHEREDWPRLERGKGRKRKMSKESGEDSDDQELMKNKGFSKRI